MNIESPQEVHLIDYFQVILRRKFIILACLFVTLTTVVIYNYVTEPIYEGKARIMIAAALNRSPLTGVQMEYDQYLEFTTHFDLITSYSVLEKVYETLLLKKVEQMAIPDKEKTIPITKKVILFITGNLSKAKRFIFDLLSPGATEVNPLMKDPDFWTTYKIRSLRGKIEVQQVKKTRLVDLKVEHKSPRLAMEIPNILAQSYIDYNRSSNFEATKASIDWLSEQLNEIKKEIRDSENKFYEFKQKEGIFSIEGKQQINTQKIQQLTNAYTNTKTKRLTTLATINRLKTIINKEDYDKIATFSTATVNNPLLDNLRRDLLNEELELSALKRTFKFEHPQIIAIQYRIKQNREKFEQELRKTLTSLKSEYVFFKEDEQSLLSNIQKNESEALTLTKKEMEYTMLEREVETNKKLYNLLFNNFTEANVIKAVPTTTIKLIEAAVYPLRPTKPKITLNLILGTILGLMVGMGLSFFLEYLNRTINTSEDVEVYLELPILSLIPKIPDKKW